jgi:cation diffusion facilitator CzcD-associated flavoprotein CzcO
MANLYPPDEHRFCIVVGAGIAGIITGCDFLRNKVLPLDEFELIDRVGGFGGVWWKNTYPGAACDIPSHVYQISWAPNPDWGKRFAPQEEIQQYYEKVALQYNLDRSTTFDTEILSAAWDDKQILWVVKTKNVRTGVEKTWTCNMLVSAAGQFSVPKKAEIDGIDKFKGDAWHTVDWPKNLSLKGKRVGIIGTGPSACQLIPHIYKDLSSLIIYQRSPALCLPRDDYYTSALRKWIFRYVPFALRLHKWYLKEMAAFFGRNVFKVGTWWQKKARELAHWHLDQQVTNEVVRNKLRSPDNFGCKRPLVLDDYYPVFNEPYVELITDPVTALDETSIISVNKETKEKQHRKIDVLIWGTGYRPDAFGSQFPLYGRDGKTLQDHYVPEMFSLYGVAVDNFPNFTTFLGPNSLTFESSVVEQMELQARYSAQIVDYLYKKNVGSFRFAVMPRAEVTKKWTLTLREGQNALPAADPTCVSYYKSKAGQVYFYPYRLSGYYSLIKKPNFKKDYVLLSGRPGQGEARVHDVK